MRGSDCMSSLDKDWIEELGSLKEGPGSVNLTSSSSVEQDRLLLRQLLTSLRAFL